MNRKDIFDNINRLLQFAEAKNGALITFNGVLLVLIISNLKLLSEISYNNYLLIISFICFSTSIIFNLLSFFPKTGEAANEQDEKGINEPKKQKEKSKNVIFFKTIAEDFSSTNEYSTALNKKLEDRTIDHDLDAEIKYNANITNKKFNKFKIALEINIIGLVFLIAAGFISIINNSSVFIQQANNYKIGAIVPLTGPFAVYGEPVNNGMQLAIEEINSNGGINGRKLELILEDSKSESKSAVNSAIKLINVDKVPIIIGPLSSGNSLAVAPISEKNKVVQLSTLAGIPELSNSGDFIFRIYPSSTIGAQFAVDKAIKMFNPKKIAVLYPSNPFGEVSKRIYSETAKGKNVDVVSIESYLDGDKDFRTQLAKIKKASPDLILCSAYWSDGATILKQMIEMSITIPIVGEDGWHGPLYQLVGNEGMKQLYFADILFGKEFKENQKMQSFIFNYNAKFNSTATTAAAIGYDAVYIVTEAIEKAEYNSIKIKDYFYNHDFKGSLGTITFDKKGDNVGASLGIFQLDSLNNAALISK